MVGACGLRYAMAAAPLALNMLDMLAALNSEELVPAALPKSAVTTLLSTASVPRASCCAAPAALGAGVDEFGATDGAELAGVADATELACVTAA